MDELANTHAFNQEAPTESQWLDGGDRYTVLEKQTKEFISRGCGALTLREIMQKRL